MTKGIVKTALVGPLADFVNFGLPSVAGYFTGKAEARESGETEERDPPSKAGKAAKWLLIPGYTGYRYGKAEGRRENKEIKSAKKGWGPG